LKISKLSVAVAATLLSSVAIADTYQVEVGAAISHLSNDSDNTNVYGVDGTYYFAPVDDSKGPREEAAFLSKASSVSLAYIGHQDAKDSYNISTRIVFGNDYIVEAGYARNFGEENVFSVGAGLYLNDHSDLVLTYERLDESKTNVVQLRYTAEQELTHTTSLGYQVGVAYVDPSAGSSGYQIDAEATYYFNHDFGLGADLGYADHGHGSDTTYGVHASYFITPAFYVQAKVDRTNFDGGSENAIRARVAYRF
jgi:hypothetical protein